jgi:hypothetical protein
MESSISKQDDHDDGHSSMAFAWNLLRVCMSLLTYYTILGMLCVVAHRSQLLCMRDDKPQPRVCQ